MTTTLSIHTTESDPDRSFEALQKAVALIGELRSIEGLRVVVSGDIQVSTRYEDPEKSEKTRLIADIRRMLPYLGVGHPELASQIEVAMKQVEKESA